jgi:hypothetical protein
MSVHLGRAVELAFHLSSIGLLEQIKGMFSFVGVHIFLRD